MRLQLIMETERHRSITAGLTAAACTLLGVNASTPAPAAATEVDTAFLFYSEPHRVSVYESVSHARHDFGGGRFADLNFTIDIMTGASANGAAPATRVQTFTRPSGKGWYNVLAGETPLDNTFQDNRFALDVDYEQKLGQNTRGAVGVHASVEYDYDSHGVNARFSRDFNRHNTTVAIGGAFARDILSPEGGPPIPFAPMLGPGVHPNRQDDTKIKKTTDGIFSLTQVLGRTVIARINYSVGQSSGYNSDPFKIISVVDTGGDPTEYVYEHRPPTRTRHSVFGIGKKSIAGDVVEASYRYMTDDWGVRSHTVETRYRHALGGGHYLQPQFRFYRQTAADFYTRFFVEGEPFPVYASSDYRLGAFDAVTVALKYGFALDDGREVNVRIGYYLQMGDSSPPEAFGSLRDVDLFPDVGAYVVQLVYSLGDL